MPPQTALSAGAGRSGGQLAHQVGVVADRPVLHALAVDDPDYVHLLVGEASTGGRQPEEVARVHPTVRAPEHHLVVLGYHVVDLPALVAECLAGLLLYQMVPVSPGGVPSGASWFTN